MDLLVVVRFIARSVYTTQTVFLPYNLTGHGTKITASAFVLQTAYADRIVPLQGQAAYRR